MHEWHSCSAVVSQPKGNLTLNLPFGGFVVELIGHPLPDHFPCRVKDREVWITSSNAIPGLHSQCDVNCSHAAEDHEDKHFGAFGSHKN